MSNEQRQQVAGGDGSNTQSPGTPTNSQGRTPGLCGLAVDANITKYKPGKFIAITITITKQSFFWTKLHQFCNSARESRNLTSTKQSELACTAHAVPLFTLSMPC